jgi:hypothetical protein
LNVSSCQNRPFAKLEIGFLRGQVEGRQGLSVVDPYYGDQYDCEMT